MKFIIFLLLSLAFIRTISIYLEYRKSNLLYKNFWSFLTHNTSISIHTKKDLFRNSRHSHTNAFEGLILDDFDFSNSKFIDVSFKGSSLKRANFNNCELQWCDFKKSNLKDATFIGTDIKPRGLIMRIFDRIIGMVIPSIMLVIGVFLLLLFRA
jgi:hypothetical protein